MNNLKELDKSLIHTEDYLIKKGYIIESSLLKSISVTVNTKFDWLGTVLGINLIVENYYPEGGACIKRNHLYFSANDELSNLLILFLSFISLENKNMLLSNIKNRLIRVVKDKQEHVVGIGSYSEDKFMLTNDMTYESNRIVIQKSGPIYISTNG